MTTPPRRVTLSRELSRRPRLALLDRVVVAVVWAVVALAVLLVGVACYGLIGLHF